MSFKQQNCFGVKNLYLYINLLFLKNKLTDLIEFDIFFWNLITLYVYNLYVYNFVRLNI